MRGDPVFEMYSSLVTTSLPKGASDFAKGKFVTKHNLMTPGPLLGDLELRAAIAESRKAAFRGKLTADNVIITGGARHALIAAVMAAADPGAEVILMPPFFGRYPGIVQITGAIPRYVPLSQVSSFQPNIGAVEQEWNPMTRAVLFASPNNPTGTVISAANIDKLQKLAKRQGGFLILDETFEAFDFSGARGNAARLDTRNTIVVGSFSETFSIPDLRVGYLIASSSVVAKVGELGNYFSLGTPMWVQQLALEILKAPTEHLERVIPKILGRHSLMTQALLSNPAIRAVYGDSGTFIWAVHSRQQSVDCRATALQMALKLGVLIKPGSEYGSAGCFRVGLGQIATEERFKRACDVLSKFSGWVYRPDSLEAVDPSSVSSNAATAWSDCLKPPRNFPLPRNEPESPARDQSQSMPGRSQ